MIRLLSIVLTGLVRGINPSCVWVGIFVDGMDAGKCYDRH
jgi:hypothetical protein